MIARCSMCQARVAQEHLDEHRRYNCHPGLHQPPHETGERRWGPIYADDGRVLVDFVPVGRWKP